jgi:hypothetical protein
MTDDLLSSAPAMKGADKFAFSLLLALGLLIFGAFGYGLYLVLPALIELAKNGIVFVGLIFVLIILLLFGYEAFLSRDAIIYKMQNIARNFRKMVVREDPVGVLDGVIRRLSDKLNGIDDNMIKAEGSIKRQAGSIAKAKKSADNERALALQAKNDNSTQATIAMHAMAAERWEKTAETFVPMKELLSKMASRLVQARDLAGNALENAKNQKSALSLQLETLQDGQAAVRGFKRFFGNNPELQMQEMAVEEIERQSAEAEAEIDQFMRAIDPMLETADLQKRADATQAMARFDAYLRGDKPVETVAPAQLTEGAITVTQLPTQQPVQNKQIGGRK